MSSVIIQNKADQLQPAFFTEEEIRKALEEVYDPEIPVISVIDLGIISTVEINEADQHILVRMTPTFSGCPAIKLISSEIRSNLAKNLGLSDDHIDVLVDMKTPWTTNNISEKGREILKNFGLAPPRRYTGDLDVSTIVDVNCPYCNSENTTMNSAFGSTLCRSIHYCFDCLQSFEQFKPL